MTYRHFTGAVDFFISRILKRCSFFRHQQTIRCPHLPVSAVAIFLSDTARASRSGSRSAPTTLWHGMMIDMGLCPTAPPTAWADMVFLPVISAICFAISPYVVVFPLGISQSIFHTILRNSLPAGARGSSPGLRELLLRNNGQATCKPYPATVLSHYPCPAQCQE